MNLKLAIIVLITLSTFESFSQPWEHYLPGSGEKYATSILETYEGGYLMPVVNESNGRSYIYKLDRDGNQIWLKTISSPFGAIRIRNICKSNDGGFLVCGVSGVFDSVGAAYIMKLDECGERLWTKEFGILNDY